jgi:hypothetical protein
LARIAGLSDLVRYRPAPGPLETAPALDARHRRTDSLKNAPRSVLDAIAQMKPSYRQKFYHHLLRAFVLSATLILTSLCLGILGYHFIARFTWIDSLLNASMILSGMGPVGELRSDAAKIFASCYALFSGVVFISSSGLLFAPMFHRVLHRFHVEEKNTP